jgi:hypothetical protein
MLGIFSCLHIAWHDGNGFSRRNPVIKPMRSVFWPAQAAVHLPGLLSLVLSGERNRDFITPSRWNACS